MAAQQTVNRKVDIVQLNRIPTLLFPRLRRPRYLESTLSSQSDSRAPRALYPGAEAAPGGLRRLLGSSLLAAFVALQAHAAIEYTKEQQETAAELIEQLEERHYSKRAYDDRLSSEHLDNYLQSLDGGKMFFTAADIRSFESFRTTMDGSASRAARVASSTLLHATSCGMPRV